MGEHWGTDAMERQAPEGSALRDLCEEQMGFGEHQGCGESAAGRSKLLPSHWKPSLLTQVPPCLFSYWGEKSTAQEYEAEVLPLLLSLKGPGITHLAKGI